MGQKCRRMEDQKLWPVCLAVQQHFAKGKRLKILVEKCKRVTWETC